MIRKLIFIFYIWLVTFAMHVSGQTSPFSFQTRYKGTKFLIAGCGWNKVAVVDKQSGLLEWEHTLGKGEDCNDVELTAQKQILYAYTGGARLITAEQHVIWEYKVKEKEELFTATQLTDGGYLLAVCGHPARIIELDNTGNTVKEIMFETGISSVHNQFRQIEKTKHNTYLVAFFNTGEVVEIDEKGTILYRIPVGGTPFMVKQLKKGNWLVACGDGHRWVEIDPAERKIIRAVSSGDLAGVSLLFVSELCRYKNGTTLVSNWHGHSKDKTQPKLMEVDKHNRIIWQLNDHEKITNISAVYVLP